VEGKNCTLEILVHLEPTPREGWAGGADEERPLNELGMRQAERLAEEIGRVDAVFGSSALRCRQSVEPIAKKSGVAVETVALNETGGNKAPVGWARPNAEGPDPLGGAYSAGTAATALMDVLNKVPDGGRGVICSYGDIIPVLLAFVAGSYGTEMPSRVNKRGSRYTVSLNGSKATIESHDASPDFPA
jgi:broad specificity phosphatase PhoE